VIGPAVPAQRQLPWSGIRRDYDEVKAYGTHGSASISGSDRSRQFGTPVDLDGRLARHRGANVPDLARQGEAPRARESGGPPPRVTIYDSSTTSILAAGSRIRLGRRRCTPTPSATHVDPFLPTPPYPSTRQRQLPLGGHGHDLQLSSDRRVRVLVLSPVAGVITNRAFSPILDAAQEMVEVRILQGTPLPSRDDEAGQGARVLTDLHEFLRPLQADN